MSVHGANQSEYEIRLIARSGMLDGISRFIAYGLSFLVNILLARMTGAIAIGSVSVSLSAINTMQLVPGMGLGLAILRKMSMFLGSGDNRNSFRVVLYSYVFTFSAACVLGIAYFSVFKRLSFAFILKSTGSIIVFDTLMLIFPLICLLPLLQATFTALQQTYKSTQYDQIVRNLLRLFVTAIALFFLSKMGALLVGTLVGICASFFIQIFIIVGVLKSLFHEGEVQSLQSSSIHATEILRYGFPLMLVPLLNAASRELDLWIVGYYLNPQQAGIYAIIRILGGILLIPLLMFGEIFSVSIAKLMTSFDYASVSQLFQISAKWIGLLSSLCFVIITCFSREILSVFGREFLDGGTALRIYAIGQLFVGFFGATGTLLLMFDKRALLIANGIGSIAINLILSLMLTPRYGVQGAALAMALTFSLSSVLVLFETIFILKISPGSFLTYIKRIGVIIISYSLIHFISFLFPGLHYAFRLILGIATTVILMASLFIATEKLEPTEKQIMTTVFKRMLPSR